MGKSKGGKYFHAPRRRGPQAGPEEEGSEEEEKKNFSSRGVGGQASTVGMLPPSDSEEEEEEGEEKEKEKEKEAKPKPQPARGQAPTAGLLPPNSSDDEDDDDDDDDDDEESDDEPVNEYLSAPRQPKKPQTEERDPETIRKEMERLELVRKKREEDRKRRIAEEGWDRFAPVSDTNRPPGSVPSDHPDCKK